MINIHFIILQNIFQSLAINTANKKNLLLSPEQKHRYRFRKTDSAIHDKYATHKILIKYTATLMLIWHKDGDEEWIIFLKFLSWENVYEILRNLSSKWAKSLLEYR